MSMAQSDSKPTSHFIGVGYFPIVLYGHESYSAYFTCVPSGLITVILEPTFK